MVLAPPAAGNLGSGAGRAVPRHDRGMEVLSSRILLRPSNPERSRRVYRDILGLEVYREFGPPEDPGLVFYLGQGLLEVSGTSHGEPAGPLRIWLQVRDVRAEHERLVVAGVNVTREPRPEPWGLVEMWIEDPDGVRIVVVEVPADHPLRRDPRGSGRSGRDPWQCAHLVQRPARRGRQPRPVRRSPGQLPIGGLRANRPRRPPPSR